MNIPRYWAEAMVREPHGKRIIRIRRFGWSHASQAEAQTMADSRAREAMERTKAGETVDRSEPRVPYNGADGMPIREEILAEHGDTIITRNSYGAHCLNTPRVMFVDIDIGPEFSGSGCLFAVPPVILGVLACLWHSVLAGLITFGVLSLAGIFGAAILLGIRRPRNMAERRKLLRERFDKWMAAHSSWRVRLYETPAGLRLLIVSDIFEPGSEQVGRIFEELGADPEYAAMCAYQMCFRARLSAKPWRAGVESHMVPRPGVWPLATDEKRARRDAWVAEYEAAAANFAACRFVGEFGTATAHPEADAVRRLHDDLSGALSGKPIA